MKVKAWLEDSHGRMYRLRRILCGYYYNKLPKSLRIMGVIHFVWKTAMASSAPILAFIYGSINEFLAFLAFGTIFLGHILTGFLDNITKEKSIYISDNLSDTIIRFGDLLNATKAKNNIPTTERDDAIRACLGILEIFARQITKSNKSDISVSLVLYSGNSTLNMKIKHRNPGNERPLNREFNSEKVLGHFACKYGGLPQVIHDIKDFGKEISQSPTQSKVSYRSIFIVPLKLNQQGVEVVKGFVSIDSKRAYAFYGNRSKDIIVTCEPVINHLRELLQEPPHGRAAKKD